MKWLKIKNHLIHYANELEEYGDVIEANYIREKILPLLDIHSDEYNQRGKHKLLELLNPDEKYK